VVLLYSRKSENLSKVSLGCAAGNGKKHKPNDVILGIFSLKQIKVKLIVAL